jgi:hypothetical protein
VGSALQTVDGSQRFCHSPTVRFIACTSLSFLTHFSASHFFSCYTALGDSSKAAFLRELQTIADSFVCFLPILLLSFGFLRPHFSSSQGKDHYLIKVKKAMMNKQFKLAEAQLLQQGKTEETIQMYKQLHKWTDALRVAESKNYAKLNLLRQVRCFAAFSLRFLSNLFYLSCS